MRLFLCLALAFLALAPLHAQVPDSLGPLQPLSPLVGVWDCQGVAHDLTGGPAQPYTSRIDVVPVLAQRWLAFTVQLTARGATRPTSGGLDYWGVDPTTGRWQEVFLDSYGGAGLGELLDLGPTRFRYRGQGSGPPEERYYEVVLELPAPGRLVIRYQASADQTTWRPRTEDSCRRVPT